MYVDPRPLTFSDLTRAVQRSAGLGDVDLSSGFDYVDPLAALNSLPVQTNAGGNTVTQAINNVLAGQAISSGSTNWMTYVGIGLAALLALGVIFPPRGR